MRAEVARGAEEVALALVEATEAVACLDRSREPVLAAWQKNHPHTRAAREIARRVETRVVHAIAEKTRCVVEAFASLPVEVRRRVVLEMRLIELRRAVEELERAVEEVEKNHFAADRFVSS